MQEVSVNASEFIAFAIYKLWIFNANSTATNTINVDANTNNAPLRNTDTAADTNNNNTNLNNHTIVPPIGTENWYAKFVLQVHSLISQSQSPLPHILISFLLISRLKASIPPDKDLTGSQMKVFTVALILAQKTHSDMRYSNKAWSKMSGFSLKALNTMEREFLQALDGKLFIKDHEYHTWVTAIQALGKEHALVLRCEQMSDEEYNKCNIERNDLREQIVNLRRRKTVNRSQTI